ncbi:MAG: response regulator transcription factor [Anaerolineaceae bacterium]|nr:response regulator transcription factor [Anaerolineaceae bacterium]MCB9100258.1 response regulator transcription factor [Anaerolineales bacterium]
MRILLADDQVHVRSALQILLKQEPNLYVVGEASDAESLVAQARAVNPDLVLVDFELPGLKESNLISMLHQEFPWMKIVALSTLLEKRAMAVNAGVDAFASKIDPPEVLVALLQSFAVNRYHINL